MGWLIAGVALWSAVHLSRPVAPGIRRTLVGALGEGPYKGLFALLVLASAVAMVFGWRMQEPAAAPVPPANAAAAMVLVFAGLVLFSARFFASSIRRLVRHPQLTAVVLWAAGHLVANGDARSLVLFGGLGLWAAVQMFATNRRDGVRPRPDRAPLTAEIGPLAVAVAAFAVLFLAHEYVSGVPLTAAGAG